MVSGKHFYLLNLIIGASLLFTPITSTRCKKNMTVRIINADVFEGLAQLEDESVNCCVTSPPYWGLRDYGVAGQIGLEKTPDEFVAKMVAVFREVRRVLRKDGTLWLNIGDSYATGTQANRNPTSTIGNHVPASWSNRSQGVRCGTPAGIKTKDLVGIPWMLARALREPYYTGRIKAESDRVWMAAMLDAEGCITASEHESNGRQKTNIYLSVTNSSLPIIDECCRIFPQEGKYVYEKASPINRQVLRWDVERMAIKAQFLREIYPYLIAKRKQAILGYTFLQMQNGLPSKKKGYLPEQQEKRSWLVSALSRLNKGENIDLPDWAEEPPSLFEPGYYLRQEIIWNKPNPMPESVRDRCTKSHEHIFLLSKSERYWYDADAIRETADKGYAGSEFNIGKTGVHQLGRSSDKPRIGAKGNAKTFRGGVYTGDKAFQNSEAMERDSTGNKPNETLSRNKRSVWTIATQPFNGSRLLADYVGADGTPYRRSEDCPIHGRNGGRGIRQTVSNGERSDHPSTHSHNTEMHHAAEPFVSPAAMPSTTNDRPRVETSPEHDPQNIDESRTPDRLLMHCADGLEVGGEFPSRIDGRRASPSNLGYEMDLPVLCNSEPATPRSMESHRTDRAPETNLAYTACVQTALNTGGMSVPPEISGSADRMRESKTERAGSDDHPSAEKRSHSVRRSSSEDLKCTCGGVSTDHFATFPEELPETCIKAGCPIGGTVLDPFLGAGTTALVADKLGRNAIGIELNPVYAEMAEKRIKGNCPLFAEVMPLQRETEQLSIL
jgi:DNA modification methylase